MEYTLGKDFQVSGVGLHSGVTTTVRISPAAPGVGRYFVRVDLLQKPIIPARLASVCQTTLSTELEKDGAKVRTVEHLLAALAASKITDVRIEIDGAEVPLLDGSAKIWLEKIAAAGIIPLNTPPQNPILLKAPLTVREGDAFVTAIPASETRFTYGIDFAYSAIGNQWYSWSPSSENFATAIAPARTFGFADQIERLREAGLIQGGNLENALVCDRQGWLNPPLRFANEPVRHKILDLVGDLSLLGKLPQAHFLAYKASHKLHIQLAQALTPLVTRETLISSLP